LTRNLPWTKILSAVRYQVFQAFEPLRSRRAMLRTRQIAVVPMMFLATVLLCAADSKSHHNPTDSAEEVQFEVVPATQEQIAPRLTPEQMPSQPLQVSYLDGQLLVIANNSTLADILAAVSSQTGAVIDVPAGSGGERVAGRIGPGPARDVLAALLNGSQFDYVIVASFPDPARVEHVVLIAKADWMEVTGPTDSPAVAANLAKQQPFQQIVSATNAPQQDTAEDIEDDSDQPITEQISVGQEPPAGAVGVLPAGSPGQAAQASPQPAGSNSQPPGNGATAPGSSNPHAPHY
jgi:hypothetical protein